MVKGISNGYQNGGIIITEGGYVGEDGVEVIDTYVITLEGFSQLILTPERFNELRELLAAFEDKAPVEEEKELLTASWGLTPTLFDDDYMVVEEGEYG